MEKMGGKKTTTMFQTEMKTRAFRSELRLPFYKRKITVRSSSIEYWEKPH